MRQRRAPSTIGAIGSCWLALGLLVAALPAHAQWKWKDEKGQTHVSDLPPPREIPDKNVLQRPSDTVRRASTSSSAPPASAASAAAADAKPRVDPEIEARKAKQEQERKSAQKAEDDKLAAQRAENCSRARQQIAGLESGMRLARVNDKGEREILDDKTRAEEMQRARQVVASECR
ncbi:DUF4124 domain-containing protein [Aquabacterium sp.]|uniref:DUF4124 domain-containing protein n=1 Tax=Aquabacterium sp. TaxID=1872578 RepID=UPI003783FD0D